MATGIPVISQLISSSAGASPNPTHDDFYGLGGYKVFPDLATRDAHPAQRLKVGMRCYVQATATDYRLVDLTPTWLAIATSGLAPADLAQADWWFDAVNGSDGNSGYTSSFPLKTKAAYLARVGYTRTLTGTQSVTLHFLNSEPDTTDRQSMKVVANSKTCAFKIVGTKTTLLTGNLTSFTASSGNVPPIITASGITDAHIGKIIFFATAQTYAVIWKDAGGGNFYLQFPCKYGNANSADMTVTNPGSTEAFTIYDAPTVYWGALEFVNGFEGGATVFPPPFAMQDVRSVDMVTFAGAASFYQQTVIDRCYFADVNVLSGAACFFRTCCFSGSKASAFTSTYQVNTLFSSCVFLNTGALQFSSCTFGLRTFDSTVHNYGFAQGYGDNTFEGTQMLFTRFLGGWVQIGGNMYFLHSSDTLMGVCTSAQWGVLCEAAKLWYTPGITASYACSGADQFRLGGTSGPQGQPTPGGQANLMPSLMAAAGGSLPALAACTTWAELAASPFNGTAYDFYSGCLIGLYAI